MTHRDRTPSVRVAIDGPAGSGKSTLARRLAGSLGLAYVNTGLMYRALAAQALRDDVSPDDGHALAAAARSFTFGLGGEPPVHLLIDGAEPGPELTDPAVEAVVSRVARHPEVREILRAEQRRLGEGGCVMEGRDIGTVVLPDAEIKLYLRADAGARSARRELERGGDVVAGRAVAMRDALDAVTNPFVPARDAVTIDTTSHSEEDVHRVARAVIDEKLASLGTGRVLAGPRSPDPTDLDPDDPDQIAPTPVDPGPARAAPAGAVPGAGPPRVAIIGRPNVGKSSLLNRLFGRREAIMHETAGVTRDRVERTVTWGGRSFVLIDTGGYTDRPRGLDASVVRQAVRATETADLVLLVVDATSGILQGDEALARALRSSPRPVLVVANKVDTERQEPLAAEFHGLGLGDPIPVSALHGRGTGDLLDRVMGLLPEGPEHQQEIETPRFCLVGRPNAGKSSIFNRLLKEERAVVHEEPGTTRDAIDSVALIEGRALRFVDTAGFRRLPRTQDVEYYGLVRSMRAIDRSHVALLVLDASEGLTGEDKRVAARVVEAGRGLVAALNKWDLLPSEDRAGRFTDLRDELRLFPGTPVLRTSALTGRGIDRLVPALLRIHEAWSKRVPTAEVNRVLEATTAAHPPPRGTGRALYATQVSAGPPTFVVFGLAYPGAAYARYLENALRREFGFEGVPVRLSFRARRAPRRPDAGRRGTGRGRPSGRRGRRGG